jgi:hypothetical protein
VYLPILVLKTAIAFGTGDLAITSMLDIESSVAVLFLHLLAVL